MQPSLGKNILTYLAMLMFPTGRKGNSCTQLRAVTTKNAETKTQSHHCFTSDVFFSNLLQRYNVGGLK